MKIQENCKISIEKALIGCAVYCNFGMKTTNGDKVVDTQIICQPEEIAADYPLYQQ